jgi:hypothetical protein
VVAGAAALLIISGAVVARADDSAGAKVQCMGVNACKGQGACATAKNDCKGKNGCKGQGMVKMSSAKDCTDKGGKVMSGDKKAD